MIGGTRRFASIFFRCALCVTKKKNRTDMSGTSHKEVSSSQRRVNYSRSLVENSGGAEEVVGGKQKKKIKKNITKKMQEAEEVTDTKIPFLVRFGLGLNLYESYWRLQLKSMRTRICRCV